ncbi:hypothetical protein APS56_06360 [Pseudalgibacter alginicilyticus]|uniref:Carbohydrate-binding domain-containing protein n=1 Tax=Pseudalgibacter alginicilyticus TaxID=1736674 RepID=A0A0P0D9Y6_9FLAO|nr:carbohydrate-binding family 9-like protein [Pseudalgibacter alginicilyticus]ALJ04769.1 hypothetical protein APS56_06360 [Pseudalgibacter alginicilyticus]
MKKKISIPQIPQNKFTGINKILKPYDYHHINEYPWENTENNRSVRFKIAHDNQNIYLHYDVTEPEMSASYFKHNDPVYKDSCVEFFIAFENEDNYYNFEFNCLGTCLLGWGANRHNRRLIDTKTIDLIKIKTKIKRINQHSLITFNWKIHIKIPLDTFAFNTFKSLKNLKAKANFYKCGDDLSKPHYITWNTIKSEKPDFHLKSFFGDIEFN